MGATVVVKLEDKEVECGKGVPFSFQMASFFVVSLVKGHGCRMLQLNLCSLTRPMWTDRNRNDNYGFRLSPRL